MIKEKVIPAKIAVKPIPNAPVNAPAKKPISYKYAGKESLIEIIRKAIPRQFVPTKRMNSIFGTIFVLALLISLAQFPFGSLLSGNADIVMKIGYPFQILELGSEGSPLNILGLIMDLLIYTILTYAVDVIISLILRNPLVQSEAEKKKIPQVFKNKKPSIAEKITEKVAEKKQLK